MTTAVLIALMVLTDAASDVLLAHAMKEVGPIRVFRFAAMVAMLRLVASNRSFVLGVLSAAIHFAAFPLLLSYADLSFVIPAGALVYVAGTLGARLFLGEGVSVRRWVGVLLICAGVALVAGNV